MLRIIYSRVRADAFFSTVFNFLLNDKFLDWSRSEAFKDNRVNVPRNFEFVFWGRVENIVVKGENAGYQHFLLFQQCFQIAFSFFFFFFRVVKSRDCVVKG